MYNKLSSLLVTV